tara:strand:- start:4 stop:231 length:228 start_codon:yes stop_codon:yes gene_type:complete
MNVNYNFYKNIDGVECYGKFDLEEPISIGYQDEAGNGLEDFFTITSEDVKNWSSLVQHIKESLGPRYTLDEVEIG